MNDKAGFEKLLDTLKPSPTGSYSLYINGAVKTVKWRNGDFFYLTYSDSTEFGWAYFNNRRYERIILPSPKAANRNYIWYDRGPYNVNPVTAETINYPVTLARKLLTSSLYAVKTSSNKNSSTWIINGAVNLELLDSANERSTIVINNKGYISSIKIGSKLRLTSNLSAPNPLVRNIDILSDFDR